MLIKGLRPHLVRVVVRNVDRTKIRKRPIPCGFLETPEGALFNRAHLGLPATCQVFRGFEMLTETDRKPNNCARTLRETANIAGVGYSTLKRYIAEGTGPVVTRLGPRTIRVTDENREAWMRRNTEATA
jgi:predicted DNA-binding transcriptional regulator AlpA